MAFSLKEEEDDCTRQCEFAKKSRADLKSKSDPLSDEKILFHNHTVLNKHMVSVKRSQHNLSRSLQRDADSKMPQLFNEYIDVSVALVLPRLPPMILQNRSNGNRE